MQFKDSVVFITGADRGLGLAYAQGAVAAGASEVLANTVTRQVKLGLSAPHGACLGEPG